MLLLSLQINLCVCVCVPLTFFFVAVFFLFCLFSVYIYISISTHREEPRGGPTSKAEWLVEQTSGRFGGIIGWKRKKRRERNGKRKKVSSFSSTLPLPPPLSIPTNNTTASFSSFTASFWLSCSLSVCFYKKGKRENLVQSTETQLPSKWFISLFLLLFQRAINVGQQDAFYNAYWCFDGE